MERADIIARLEHEAPVFAGYRQRVERTAGLDAELNYHKKASLSRIDHLLDCLNCVALENIPVIEVAVNTVSGPSYPYSD